MTVLRNNRLVAAAIVLILVASYIFYFVNQNVATSMFKGAWFFAVPLVLGALTGVVGERSGVVNIGIEGQMLVAAFAAFFSAAASGSLVVGILVGMVSGIAMGAFLSLTTVKGLMDQIIAGVVINIVATGLTSFFYRPGKVLSSNMPQWNIPGLSKIPLIGDVFFQTGPIALFALVSFPVMLFALFTTRWGLRTRPTGGYRSAAATAAINGIG